MGLLVLDKSSLQRGSSADRLGRLCLRGHTILITWELVYEIMSEEGGSLDPHGLFPRLGGLPYKIARNNVDLRDEGGLVVRPAADIVLEGANIDHIIQFPENVWREDGNEFLRTTRIDKVAQGHEKLYASLPPSEKRQSPSEWLMGCVAMRDDPGHLYEKLDLEPETSISVPPQAWITANFWCLMTHKFAWRRCHGDAPVGVTKLEHEYCDVCYLVCLTLADGLISEDKGTLDAGRAFFPARRSDSLEDWLAFDPASV